MTNRLFIPETLWQVTSELFQGYASKRVEAGCFWYGIRDDTSIAVTLGIPHQTNRRGNFHIEADDLAALVKEACAPGLVAVAQLHLHPGSNVDHSSWDDRQIVSRNLLSIVIPNYGAQPLDLDTLGVHRFQHNHWRRLSTLEAQQTVQLVRKTVDMR